MSTETTTVDNETPQHPFEKGLELYEAKGELNQVIEFFEQGVLLSPKDTTGYTCLSWLHLLRGEEGDAQKGLNYASKGLKCDPSNHQAHFNLVLAMLVSGRTGVRQELSKAKLKCRTPEDVQEVTENLQDAIERRPDFDEAAKLLKWIQG